MTTPLPSRLRESAKAMKSLDSVSLRPSTLALIDRESAARIASELEQAADALEAGRGKPVAWMMQWPNHGPSFTTDKSDYVSWVDGKPTYPENLIPLYAAPAAQVAQESAPGVATDGAQR